MSVARFAHGECGAFAVACYQKHAADEWRLAIMNDEMGTPCHAACQTPDGRYFDAYGYVSLETMESRYDRLLFPQVITEEVFQQYYAESVVDVVMAIFGFDEEDTADAADFLAELEGKKLHRGASAQRM